MSNSLELNRIANILERIYNLQKKEFEIKYGAVESLSVTTKEFTEALNKFNEALSLDLDLALNLDLEEHS